MRKLTDLSKMKIVLALILLLTFVNGFIGFNFLSDRGEKITDEDIAFIQWSVCLESSDYTDAECEFCDLKYNPNNYDFGEDFWELSSRLITK